MTVRYLSEAILIVNQAIMAAAILAVVHSGLGGGVWALLYTIQNWTGIIHGAMSWGLHTVYYTRDVIRVNLEVVIGETISGGEMVRPKTVDKRPSAFWKGFTVVQTITNVSHVVAMVAAGRFNPPEVIMATTVSIPATWFTGWLIDYFHVKNSGSPYHFFHHNHNRRGQRQARPERY